ncbi:hypothetical protein Tco_1143156 [Tanacetum coccineum]
MHEDYEYVKSLEKEVDELESKKADFSNIYDLLLEECVSKDVTCSYLHSLSDFKCLKPGLNACIFIKSKNVNVLHKRFSKQTESVNKRRFECSNARQEHRHQSKSPTSVSRPQLKCYQLKISSNSKTLNVMLLCAECGKYVFNSNHDVCVSRYLNDVNARTKKPKVVPISASKPKRKVNKSVATPHKKTVASDTTIQKSKSYYKELYKNTNQEWKWWIAKKCPSGYKWTQKPHRTKKIWMPKIRKEDVSTRNGQSQAVVVNIVRNFLVRVRFRNDQFAPILGYGDLNQGNIMIKRVYYVEGLNHNLFSVGQFCDADLEVAFRKSTFCL